jgi:uncharacterized membrane protein YoaK (UPF0700 family)/anti-anti-sigma regulatory factor
MFVSQAHSFKQQARLAVTLAWVAGYTNIIAVLTCGTVISHASGTTSNLGHHLMLGEWRLSGYALFLLMMFFLGAVVSGFFTELGHRRGWESIYVLPMMAEMVLLGVFALGIDIYGRAQGGATFLWMTGAASMAMGLQNATITRISNGVVRTTHVTGVLTDLGLGAVQMLWWLRDKRNDVPPGSALGLIHSAYSHPTSRRLAVLGSIIFTFALGAALGTAAYQHVPRLAMFPPVLFLLWIVYQDVTTPIAEIEASDIIAANDLPSAVAVYHLRKDRERKSGRHRMPNLLEWSDRLPATARVVILDLGEVTQINANSAMELGALLERFESQGRRLVVAGVSNEQFQQIRSAGALDLLDPDNICPDLELAVARGLNLLESADAHAVV